LIAPSAAIFVALFIAPFIYFFFLSFWQVKLFKLSADLSTKNYVEAYDRSASILAFTIEMAAIVALITTVLGFVYAYIIRFKAGRWGPALLLIALVTLFGGYLMKIYAWKTILGNEGVLNSGLISLGVVSEPITAIFYSPGAVVVTLVHFLLPFAILPIYASLRGIDDIELEASRDLGAKPWHTLGGIIIPQCKAGLIAAFTFCFLLPAGDYVTPLLVGGKIQLIGNMVRDQFGKSFNWPLGSAMAVSILACALLVVVLANTLMSFWRPR
jgi:spermidine/putrescine transport system permease protein